MKNDQFLRLFDSDKISPNIRESQGGPPVYFAGGYAPSLGALKQMNENATIGQVGGSRRRRRSRRSRRSRKTQRRR
jgi:hypothetical protein